MKIITRIILSALAVLVSAYFVNSLWSEAVTIEPLWISLFVALVLSLVNLLIRPIIVILSLPLTILTLGLFLFVINGLMVILVSWLVPGFHFASFWLALIFSIFLSLLNWLFNYLIK